MALILRRALIALAVAMILGGFVLVVHGALQSNIVTLGLSLIAVAVFVLLYIEFSTPEEPRR